MSNPILNRLLGKGASEVIEQVTSVVDKYVTSPEEKEQIRQDIERAVTDRWVADMSSDSWLSKNVRPLTLIVVVVALIVMTFFDGASLLSINEAWISLWSMVSVSVIGGYFAVRTIDKRGKIK